MGELEYRADRELRGRREREFQRRRDEVLLRLHLVEVLRAAVGRFVAEAVEPQHVDPRSAQAEPRDDGRHDAPELADRKSTRLNSSHTVISYAVFCLKK